MRMPISQYDQHLKGDDEQRDAPPNIKNAPAKLPMYTLTDEPGYGPRTGYNGYSGYSGDV